MNTSTWIEHEGGWHTLRGVGGICEERGGWTFWPLRGEPIRGLKSLDDAKRTAIYGRDLRTRVIEFR